MRGLQTMKLALRLACSVLLGALAGIMRAAAPAVTLGPNGTLNYTTDAVGNRMLDFSYAGYGGGGVVLPAAAVVKTITAVTGDNTANIQNALNTVAASPRDTSGLRGALLLKAGTYDIAGSLTISASGVVLRGEGSGTVLHFTGLARTCLTVTGGTPGTTGNAANITDAYVPLNARTFHVNDTTGFAVGNLIVVQRSVTQTWIDAIGMTPYWTPNSGMSMERMITAIAGNQITVDIPLCNPIEAQYTVGQIRHYDDSGRIDQVGLESLRARADMSDYPDNILTGYFVSYDNLKNSWIRDVVFDHWGNGLTIGSHAKWVTVQDCQYVTPATGTSSAAPSAYNISGQLVLIHRCTSSGGYYHIMTTQSATAGPNVFLNFTASGTNFNGGPHQRWAAGALFDNIVMGNDTGGSYTPYLAINNRTSAGSGQGWAAGYSVMFNCQTPQFQLEQPASAPYHYNWAIGGKGSQRSYSDPGTYQSFGSIVQPASLYRQQLQERLGPAAVANIGYTPTVAPDFTLTTSSGTPTVVAGNTVAFTVNVGAIGGFTGAVNFSVTGLPGGMGASFNPVTVSGAGPVVVTVSTSADTPPDSYQLNVIGTSGGITRSVVLPLIVSTPYPAPTFDLAGGIYGGAKTIAITAAAAGASVRYTLDGTTPTQTTGFAYTGPVSITATSTLTAVAYKAGFPPSAAASAAYTITTPSRIVNLSVRTRAGRDAETLIAGFVISGSGNKPVLVRSIGPTLAQFGVTDALADPQLTLKTGGQTVVATNDNWSADPTATPQIAAIAAQVGAFALPNGSLDASIVATLPAASYTGQVSTTTGAVGTALVEVYDASTSDLASARLINLSARAQVSTGDGVLIAGFVVAGQALHRVLVRGIGPGLTPFGVAGALVDPQLSVYTGNTLIATNDNWGNATSAPAITAAAASVGAFALTDSSRDAVLLLTLPPGAYTAQVSGAGNTTGVALVEVYEVQF
jgi:hypothetical protein